MSIPVPPVPTFAAAEFTLTSLKGLKAAGVKAGIKASGNPDVGLLVADVAMPIAAIFTQNHFAAAPVLVSKAHLAKSGGMARAIIVNSGNANACTGVEGHANAIEMCQRVATALQCPLEQVLVCSTGVIGQPLPMDKVRNGIDLALKELANDLEAGRRFLAAIMTTDAFPKEASVSFDGAIAAGICKGAGMIQPDMATMLAFMGTDVKLTPGELMEALPAIARRSFNAVHVDTHTSTNDSLFLFSTAQKPKSAEWKKHVESLAHRLSWLIARDGEGATKVTTIEVTGAQSNDSATRIARHVAASALVRTALFGNDPNWGRFVSQVGNVPEVKSAQALTCVLQGIVVFQNGEPTKFDRAAASKAMNREDVKLELKLKEGSGEAIVLTSDLGYRYVQVNAEYTT